MKDAFMYSAVVAFIIIVGSIAFLLVVALGAFIILTMPVFILPTILSIFLYMIFNFIPVALIKERRTKILSLILILLVNVFLFHDILMFVKKILMISFGYQVEWVEWIQKTF